ncbi:MAG TPA: ATP-binding protein [Chroococcidiopsis sp.]
MTITKKRLKNISALIPREQSTASTVDSLKPSQSEFKRILEELHATQKALQQANQKLACAHHQIIKEQQQLQAAHQKISEQTSLLRQLETQFHRVQQMENLGSVASGIAHDLNNIFTPILTLTQLLRLNQASLDGRSQEMLKVLEDSAKRGATMIKKILTSTQGTSQQRRPLQIVSLVQEVISTIRHVFPSSISIRQSIPQPILGLVLADATEIHQILMNLCMNARDAMTDGGILKLSIEQCSINQISEHGDRHGDRHEISEHGDGHGDRHIDEPSLIANQRSTQSDSYIVITVSDTGTGIHPSVRDRIFEPFFTTKKAGQGTGLGLATVLDLVNKHNGFLQVFSEVGQGTSIKVYLPVSDSNSL